MQSLVIGGSSLVISEGKRRAIPCNWRVLPCNIRRKGCVIPCNWRALPCNIRRKSGASSPRTKHMTRRCSGGNRSISARPNAAHTRTGHHAARPLGTAHASHNARGTRTKVAQRGVRTLHVDAPLFCDHVVLLAARAGLRRQTRQQQVYLDGEGTCGATGPSRTAL